jgi:hypothetical protein
MRYDTTEPRYLFNIKKNKKTWSYIHNNRILKILDKAGHPIEFISPQDYPEYLRKQREIK